MQEIRVGIKKRREKLFFIRMGLGWVLMVGALLVIFVFTMGSRFTFNYFILFSLLCIPLSALYSMAVERIGSSFGTYLSGWSSRRVSPRETILADLGRARYSKMRGSHAEALNILKGIIARVPDSPDALLLMAQVQYEGFQNYSEAKKCLQKIMLIVPRNETMHNWASSYYDDIMGYEKKKYVTMDGDKNKT